MMNKKIVAIAVSLIVIIATVVVYVIMNRPISSATAVLRVDPSTASASIGQNFTINLSISNVVDLFGYQIKLRWNPMMLDAINAAEKPFLKSGGSTWFVPKINNTVGYALVDCTLLSNVAGVNGSGILATVQFHVKTSGSCDLALYDTALLNSTENLIPHAVTSGRFSASP